MNLTTRFFIYAPFALFVTLALGVSILWFSQAEALSQRFVRLNGHSLMPGVTLHFSSKRIEGFPFRLDAVFRDFEIDVATPHGPASWRSDDFALHRLTYDPDTTLFEAAGRQLLSWTDEKGKRHTAPVAIGAAHASEVEDGRGLERFDLVAARIDTATIGVDALQFHLRRERKSDSLLVYIDAEGMRAHEPVRSGFGRDIEQLTLSGAVLPDRALANLESGTEAWPASLQALKAAAGRLELSTIAIGFTQLQATGKGAISLDQEFRPEGKVDFRITHFSSLLDGHPQSGLATAIRDRARAAGASATGEFGMAVGAKDGVILAGDEPVGVLLPLL